MVYNYNAMAAPAHGLCSMQAIERVKMAIFMKNQHLINRSQRKYYSQLLEAELELHDNPVFILEVQLASAIHTTGLLGCFAASHD
jgi:hypothetical protein